MKTQAMYLGHLPYERKDYTDRNGEHHETTIIEQHFFYTGEWEGKKLMERGRLRVDERGEAIKELEGKEGCICIVKVYDQYSNNQPNYNCTLLEVGK